MRTLIEKRIFVCIVLACGLVPADARADTVTLNAIADTTISEKSLESSLGSDITLDSGTTGPNEGLKKNRALLKFDLSEIPTNAVITSVALTLTLVTTPTTTNLWFSLHKVLLDWTESAATWTNRLSPPAPWNAPGGLSSLDYSSSVSQSNLISGASVPATFTFVPNSGLINDVQDWTSNPANNFGWILLCELEDLEKSVRKFASSERTATNQRPSLLVEFSVPAAPLTLTVLPLTNGQFQFQFHAASNKSYTVLYGNELGSSNWAVLTNLPPLSTPATILISDPLSIESNRFYRVQTP
jgi:hypothetical protein